MTDSHFSDSRDRSSNQNRSSNHFRKSSIQIHNKPPSQPQPDRSSSQPHNKSPNNQPQRQQFEFRNKFFKLFQGAQNKFFIIDENFEYINDCFEQYAEENIENHIL